MTIVVGIEPGQRNTAALSLAGTLAAMLREPVVAVSVIQFPDDMPSPLRVGMEDSELLALIATGAIAQARAMLGDALVDAVAIRHRSVRSGLLEAVAERRGSHLVLGSNHDDGTGRVLIGPAADALLHASTVPVHLAPPAFRRSQGERPVHRLTVGFGPGDGSGIALRVAAGLADQADATVRTATFYVRPPKLGPWAGGGGGLSYEAQLAAQWREQMEATVKKAVDTLGDELGERRWIHTDFGQGSVWPEAIDSIPWEPDEILVLGSRPRGGVRGVFLGSNAAEIVRSSVVPVMVLPG
ncbi:MAG: universal stress protein [Patulibacter sp.]|nr:universal stress protein [Patulibacter sp.]